MDHPPRRSPRRRGGCVFTRRDGRYSLLTRRDKVVMGLMVGIPTFLCLSFIWLPTLASIGLSFTNWRGITADHRLKNFVGLKNYETLFTAVPAVLAGGLAQRPLAARSSCSSRRRSASSSRSCSIARCAAHVIYQSAFYIPVVLSLAIVGFIWEQMYTSQGFINSILGHTSSDTAIDFLGNPSLNIWAVLVAASWRHVGYVMVLYLAGLKSVDPHAS